MATRRVSSSSAKKKLRALPGWELGARGRSIRTEFRMKDFVSAVRLIGRIAPVAERMDHHPDLHLTRYRVLRIELSTHSIGGLSGLDFRLAAKINALPKQLKKSA